MYIQNLKEKKKKKSLEKNVEKTYGSDSSLAEPFFQDKRIHP